MKRIKKNHIYMWLLLIILGSFFMVQVAFAADTNNDIPNMDIINQDIGNSLEVSLENNSIDLNQAGTTGGFMSNSLNNVGFLVTENAIEGDFSISADIQIEKQYVSNESAGIFLGAFTGTDTNSNLFTVASKNNGTTGIFFSNYDSKKSVISNNSKYDKKEASGNYTVTRSNNILTAKFIGKNGDTISAATQSDLIVPESLSAAAVKLGIGCVGVEANITNLVIKAADNTVLSINNEGQFKASEETTESSSEELNLETVIGTQSSYVDSNTVESSTETAKESSETIKESSETVKESNETIKESSETVKESNETENTTTSTQVQDETITFGNLTSENGKILIPWSINGLLESNDSFKIDMLNETGEYLNTVTYSSQISGETAQFNPISSGSYIFRATLYRAKTDKTVVGEVTYSKFELPLEKPIVETAQNGSDSVLLRWKSVPEATNYSVVYKVQGGSVLVTAVENTSDLQAVVSGLAADKKYVFWVVALKNNIKSTSDEINVELVSETVETSSEETKAVPKRVSCYVNSLNSTSEQVYEYNFISNSNGTLNVTDKNGNIVIQNQNIEANVMFAAKLNLERGSNEFTAVFNPSKEQNLESYSNMMIRTTVEYKVYNQNILYVTPQGNSTGDGTKESPLDIYTACDYIKPGQVISLSGGTYKMTKELNISYGNNGTAKEKKYLLADNNNRAILDFSGTNGNLKINGDYWHISNVDICNTSDNVKGVQISGSYNTLDRVDAYLNGDTGICIAGYNGDKQEKWPSNNLILNCTSYNNCDSSHINADGFSTNVFIGIGNVFKGCVAYNNIGDGFDLSDKLLSETVNPVTIESCVAYKNGETTCRFCNMAVTGEGNGFKLGFAGISVENVLKNSIAFDNVSNGITTNSNPAAIVENTISAFNKGSGFKLFGQTTELITLEASNVISFGNVQSDVVKLDSLINETNYFDDKNSLGEVIASDMFISVDYKNFALSRNNNGSINMNGLFVLNDKSPESVKTNLNFEATSSQVVLENGAMKINTDETATSTNINSETENSTDVSLNNDITTDIAKETMLDEESQSENSVTVKRNFNPFTGDSNPLVLMFAIAGISLVVIILLIVIAKKNKKNKK